MKNAFNQAACHAAAKDLLDKWGLDYSIDPDSGIIAVAGDFHRPGERGSTTRAAAALAERMFGSKDALFLLNMAEFRERHEVAKLMGAPPGFVGSDDDSGAITRRLREQPRSLLVLDEIDKAHPDIRKLLGQAAKDRKIIDARGATVSLEEVVIVTTIGPPTAPARAEQQSKIAIEIAIRATEGVPQPVQVMKPLRFRGTFSVL